MKPKIYQNHLTNELFTATLEQVPITTPTASYSLWYVRLTQVNGIHSDFCEYAKPFYSRYKQI